MSQWNDACQTAFVQLKDKPQFLHTLNLALQLIPSYC